ncbi:MAG: type VII secretion-associated serine protease mycosin [Micromonosporaceae bacterium]|nr:type VII secretion-associated serine protease mycosin [Micromonosporaceae bacterium]
MSRTSWRAIVSRRAICGTRRLLAGLGAVLVVLATSAAGVLVGPAAPAAARDACMEPTDVIKPVPWAQKLLMPERVWPLATGAGIKIGVLDSGVDASHVQMSGKVTAGKDYLFDKDGPGNTDCVGHGTAVASIMVAKQSGKTGFRGIAPDATVVPVIVSEKEGEDEQAKDSFVTPSGFADALRWVIAQDGVRVVNLSLAYKEDYPEVRAAVQDALAADVVVVAAVGNFGQESNPTTYPAAYDGVIGVGAIDQNSAVLPSSGKGSFVDLVAPGAAVVAAVPGAGHSEWGGTSFAAPFVAATAALVRQYYPKMTAKGVAARLYATASPAAGGPSSTEYGHGIVDPYRAVAEQLPVSAPASVKPRPVVRSVDPQLVAKERKSRHDTRIALIVGGVAALVTLLALGVMLVRRWGRGQGWRPARAANPEVPDEDPTGAPARLFDDFP